MFLFFFVFLSWSGNMSIKPSLGKLDLTMIVVSMVIGIGIFRTPATVAQKAGIESVFFGAWILGGLISLCGALTLPKLVPAFLLPVDFTKYFRLAIILYLHSCSTGRWLLSIHLVQLELH